MSKADKSRRHNAKRKAKRQATRRQQSVSPVKRLAAAPGELECWASEDFDSNGQIQLFAYKRGAGLSGVACFLVDRGVVGLKDAWVSMLDRAEFNDMLEQSKDYDVPMHRVSPEELRRWVAGGVRWAHENGMRLPKDWQRTASLIGGVGDWHSADVSAFVKEFAGHPEDLRQRLLAEPLETYLKRPDIDFIFNESAPYMDQATGRYSNDPDDLEDLDEDELEAIGDELPEEEINALAAKFVPAATALAADTATWLATQNESPSPELAEAWSSVMIANLVSRVAMPEAPEDEVADFGFELLQDIAGRIDDDRYPEYDRAIGQVLHHLQTDTMMMQKAVLKHGFPGEPKSLE